MKPTSLEDSGFPTPDEPARRPKKKKSKMASGRIKYAKFRELIEPHLPPYVSYNNFLLHFLMRLDTTLKLEHTSMDGYLRRNYVSRPMYNGLEFIAEHIQYGYANFIIEATEAISAHPERPRHLQNWSPPPPPQFQTDSNDEEPHQDV